MGSAGWTLRGKPSAVIITGGSPTVEDDVCDAVGCSFGERELPLAGSSVVTDSGSSHVAGDTLVDGDPIAVRDAGGVEVTGERVSNADTGTKAPSFGGYALIQSSGTGSARTGMSVSGSHTERSDNAVTGSDIIGPKVASAGPTLTGDSITGGGTGLRPATPDVATGSGNTSATAPRTSDRARPSPLAGRGPVSVRDDESAEDVDQPVLEGAGRAPLSPAASRPGRPR